ncbi:MAG: hypothetical protein EP330_29725 [Deltaproteobacteria bacterium]|nr:MAG: hypothetical protein EP330_29725 [Deltaproteobacteria bacterium]
MRPLFLFAITLPTTALAAFPEDVVLSEMVDYRGVTVAEGSLTEEYKALIMELGTSVANQAVNPAETVGAFGFDVGIVNTFAFINSRTKDGQPSAWERAHADENPNTYLFTPGLQIRKGLPMSFEVGARGGWVGNSRQGVFSGFGRWAVVEGYKPAPDISLHAGYAAYLGNPELDLGVWDMGATMGGTWAFGSYPGINQAQISLFADFSLLRISAVHRLDAATASRIGAENYYSGPSTAPDADSYQPGISVPRVSAGLQVTNGNAHFRLTGGWVPSTIPTLNVGMGFTY